jgi:dUTP pyrophosphatase
MTSGASGFDLHACVDAPVEIAPGRWSIVPTGLILAIPEGYEGVVRARSGLAARHGVGLLNGPGTIDSDYRGELGVILMNWGPEPFVVRTGDRIAQLVFQPVPPAQVVWREDLPETSRGSGGFGHTGTRPTEEAR